MNDLNNCRPCSKGDSSGAGNGAFHSCKWLWELWMLTVHCVRDGDDGQGAKCIQKSYFFSVCFIQELVLLVMEVKPKYIVHLCHITCLFWFLALWQGTLRLHAKHCFGGPFLFEMQLSFFYPKHLPSSLRKTDYFKGFFVFQSCRVPKLLPVLCARFAPSIQQWAIQSVVSISQPAYIALYLKNLDKRSCNFLFLPFPSSAK